MTQTLNFSDKIGILDPTGVYNNPLTNEEYSNNYKKLSNIWSSFPAYEKAEQILNSIENNQLLFIVSGTGSGKTVLIPKFVLHYFGYKGKIAITLPKKIVTFSAATFAAETLDVKLGIDVGYSYKGSPREMASPDNKLIYMTDGLLIMYIVEDPLLTKYNCIIIDEAHERSVRIDLLLLFLKKLLLSGKRPDLKVIIMSATINSKKFKDYFSGVKSEVVNISGQPNHDISVHFLDKPSNSYMTDGLKLIEKIAKNDSPKRDLLFFITTSNEAQKLCKEIRPKFPKVFCIEVYSEMDNTLKIYAQSRDKYLELGEYDQKLIMATNVAESSLTIDGLKYVIDSGYELFSYFDPENYGDVLETRLISKAQALQRRGRVGRTETGICYHLLTEKQFNSLKDYPDPDILKQDITMDLLKIIQITPSKTLNDGIKMLNQLMDIPKKEYIDSTLALFKLYKLVDDSTDKLTQIAYDVTQFSSVPLNRILFLIYSYQFNCAKEASIILSLIDALNGKMLNLFHKKNSMICESKCQNTDAAKKIINEMADPSGDHLTLLKINNKYRSMQPDEQKKWANKYGIRQDIFIIAGKIFKSYYYKILGIYSTNKMNTNDDNKMIGGKDMDTYDNILNALKLSHQHLTAINMSPVLSTNKITAQINKESTLIQTKNISKNIIIYDKLSNINGTWDFSIVSIAD